MTRNNICILPWVSIAVMPTGNVYPCCMTTSYKSAGNVNDSTLEEIWNGERMQYIRTSMLEDKKLDMCSECWKVEEKGNDHSTRNWANKNFKHHFDLLDNTVDGKVDLNLIYTDIRFSNKCNLMCFYCGPIFSSKWDAFNKKHFKSYKPLPPISDTKHLLSSILEHSSSLEQIYLSGGEPSIMDESYTMLEMLIDIGIANNIKLLLNSNMSNKTYKHNGIVKNFWDLISQFKEVELSASIDEIEERAEWIRYGEKWDNIVETNDYVKQYPNINVQYSPVMSVFNFHRLPEMLLYWQSRGWIDKHFNIVLPAEPGFGTNADFKFLPHEFKLQTKEKLEKFMKDEVLIIRNELLFNTISSLITSMIDYNENSNSIRSLEQVSWDINLHDSVRKSQFNDIFPELNFLKTTK